MRKMDAWRVLRRLLAVIGGIGVSVFFANPALAGSVHVAPTISPTQSTFTIPGHSTSVWTLRLWSHGVMKGLATGESGTLVVSVPHTADCAFQADVKVTPPGGQPTFYSGNRATMAECGPPPPTQTIAGHIYLCTPAGSPTTTEVSGGTVAVSGPQTVASQANPLAPTDVASGDYTMTAGSPTGYLLVACGGSATIGSGGLTGSEPVTVPSGGAGVGVFYASAPAVGNSGGPNGSATTPPVAGVTASSNSPSGPSAPVAGATAAGHNPPAPPVATTDSQLAFTGMNPEPPVLVGLTLLGLGTLMIACSSARRRSRVVLPVETGESGRSSE